MTAEDTEALAAVHAAAFAGSPMRAWRAAEFTDLLDTRGVTLFGEGGPPPEGFVIVRQVLDEAEVLTLAVAPARHRCGVGRALMARATESLRAAGVTRLFLEVASTNDVARRLYADLGFVETGLRRGYFRSGTVDDAVTMVKTLEP